MHIVLDTVRNEYIFHVMNYVLDANHPEYFSSDIVNLFGDHYVAAAFFAIGTPEDGNAVSESMLRQDLVDEKYVSLIGGCYKGMGHEFPYHSSDMQVINHIKAHILLGMLLETDPRQEGGKSYDPRVVQIVSPGASYTAKDKEKLIEDFTTYIVGTHTALGLGPTCPASSAILAGELYKIENLNKIIDNPFIEEELRQYGYSVHLAKAPNRVPDARDVKILEQICFQSILRKQLPTYR